MFKGGLQPRSTTFRLSNKAPGKAAVASIPTANPSAVDPSCNETITPTCLLQLYNAVDYKVQSAHKGNKIAISSYLGTSSGCMPTRSLLNLETHLEQFANIADLEQFYHALRPEAFNSTFKLVSIKGDRGSMIVFLSVI
jgi:tripeptidyl-peptidase-1